MGSTISGILSRLWSHKKYRFLILGLDSAGKTTILNYLKKDEPVTTTLPTIGFNVDTVTIQNAQIQVWDLGGQASIRPYWRCYYAGTDGIIFVIDSADAERLSTAKVEMLSMIQEEELKSVPLLILANKQDLPNALSDSDIAEALDMAAIKDRPWSVVQSSAISGTGLNTAFDWIVNEVKQR